MKIVAIFLINIYKFCVSPFIDNVCIYQVSCSEYSIQAFKENSFFRALLMSVKRILSCHPWNKNIS